MNTFEALVTAVLYTLGEILPLGQETTTTPLVAFADWSNSLPELVFSCQVGILCALVFTFRFDLLSMLSSLIRIIVYRKKPMTIDERMPLFIIIATVPALLFGSSLATLLDEHLVSKLLALLSDYFTPSAVQFVPLILCTLVGGGALFCSDYFGKHQRKLFDWNTIDALGIGVLLLLFPLLPSFNGLTIALIYLLYRHYRRETALKIAFQLMIPSLLVKVILGYKMLDLHANGFGSGNESLPQNLMWISWAALISLSLITSLLAINAALQVPERAGFLKTVLFRCLVASSLMGGLLFGRL